MLVKIHYQFLKKACNEFSFNKADVIISLKEVSYIHIKEGSTLIFHSIEQNQIQQTKDH